MAGDITTSGQFVTADGEYTYEDAFEMYKEQITILKNAGVDLIAAETMINIEETLAAVDAANSVCDLPVMCTVTVEADGSIFSGGNAVEALLPLRAQERGCWDQLFCRTGSACICHPEYPGSRFHSGYCQAQRRNACY